MSNEWPKMKLADVLEPVTREEPVEATKEYRLLGIRLDGQGPFLREVVTGTQTSATKLSRVEPGDFIYSRLFAWRGAFGVISSELDGCYVSGEFPTFLPKKGLVDVRFLRQWFRMRSTLAQVEEDCSGSTPLTRNRFKEEYFLALEISLPALLEQERIVKRIEELSKTIEDAKALRAQALEQTDSLLHNRIGEVFDELSRQFPVRKFGSFSPHVTSGPRNWAKHYENNGYRFYRAQDIGPAGYILEDNKVFITPPAGDQGRSAMLRSGDLMLVITGATVGRAAIFCEGLEAGFVSQHVAICRLPLDQVDPEFVLWGLRGPAGQAQLLGQRYGQGKPGLKLSNIKSLSLPFPPITEQRRIVSELNDFQAQVNLLKKLQADSAVGLNALTPSILDKAFRGEL